MIKGTKVKMITKQVLIKTLQNLLEVNSNLSVSMLLHSTLLCYQIEPQKMGPLQFSHFNFCKGFLMAALTGHSHPGPF